MPDPTIWVGHLEVWENVAVISDADCLENSVRALGRILPGEMKVFEADELDAAKDWPAGTGAIRRDA
jgi:hypothetical protein